MIGCSGLIAASYLKARDYVAGYLDMTGWANPNIKTNYTVGFFVLFGLWGATVGTAIEIVTIKLHWKKQNRLMAMAIGSLLGTLAFAQVLSLTGLMEGGRFA